MLRRFLDLHKRLLETLGEAIGLDLLWSALRYLGVFGAGFALAAGVHTLTSASPRRPRVPVPFKLARETSVQRELVRKAHRYGPGSGIVYVWGGSSPQLGFDCSGFVYFVYGQTGITIPRSSRSQWSSTTGVDVRKKRVQPGDAVYFVGSTTGVNAGPPPGHVGLYVGHGRYIQYYSGGKPAIVSRLSAATDYMGAKRWWPRLKVDKHDSGTIFWFARDFHVKVANSRLRWVEFKAWGHRRLSRSRLAEMKRWARNHHRRAWGNRKALHVRFKKG